MRSRYRVHDQQAAHFVTSTVIAWLPIFTTAVRCDILVQALRYCRENKGVRIYAWVVLDNHFHAILDAPDLMSVMRDFKRHTARRIVELLQEEQCTWLLERLERLRAEHKFESAHQVWQEGFHPVAIVSDEIMQQKLTYLHNNPVARGLVAAPEHWRYSSAHEWCGGVEPVLRCDAWWGS